MNVLLKGKLLLLGSNKAKLYVPKVSAGCSLEGAGLGNLLNNGLDFGLVQFKLHLQRDLF